MKSDKLSWSQGKFKEQLTKLLDKVIANGKKEDVTLEDTRVQLRKVLKISKYR